MRFNRGVRILISAIFVVDVVSATVSMKFTLLCSTYLSYELGYEIQ